MKRKITEIFIEVEETIELRLSEQSSQTAVGETEEEKTICPQCRQIITNIIEKTEKKIERREIDDKF